MKRCKKCNIEKDLSEFNKNKQAKDGIRIYCKKCTSETERMRYLAVGKIRKPENRASQNLSRKKWHHKKISIDPIYKFKYNLRRRLALAIKRNFFSQEVKGIIGLDLYSFKNYIANRFKAGMTWENHGEWQIDHIMPLSSGKTEAEVLDLCYYTNLQPLWEHENVAKGIKVDLLN